MDPETKPSNVRAYFRSREFKIFLYTFLLSLTAIPISLILLNQGKIDELGAAFTIMFAIALPALLFIIFTTIIIFRLVVMDLSENKAIGATHSKKLTSYGCLIPLVLVILAFVTKISIFLPIAIIVGIWLALTSKDSSKNK